MKRAIEAARTKPWYETAGRPELPDKDQPRYAWYRRVMVYDPMPVLRRLDIPALVFYGARDELVDAQRSAEIMRRLKDDEHKDFTIVVYPEGTHNLTSDGFKFPDDHWDRIFAWIRKKCP